MNLANGGGVDTTPIASPLFDTSGNVYLEDGTVIAPDGTAALPDGTTIDATGAVISSPGASPISKTALLALGVGALFLLR